MIQSDGKAKHSEGCPTVLLARDVLAGLEREKNQESRIEYFKTSEPCYQRERKDHAHTRRILDAKDHEFAEMKDRAESAEAERDLLRVRLEALVEAAELHFTDGHGDDRRFWGDSLVALRAALDAARVEKEG